MTDNRTTELRVKRLRELLDERGIEHYDHENGEPLRVLEKAEEPATSWRANGASYCAVPDGKGTFDIWIDHCTPEQAIAATLGSDREAELIRAMEDVLRHSTDTVWAGEVETLVERMVSLGVYGHDVYEGARPWEADE